MPRTRSGKVTTARTPTQTTPSVLPSSTPAILPVSPPLQLTPPTAASSFSTPPPRQGTCNPTGSSGTPYYLARYFPRLLRQLVIDIDQAGGISTLYSSSRSYSLSQILDSRPDIYGTKDDKELRRKIQQRVYRWHLLDKSGKYTDTILRELGVSSVQAPTSPATLSAPIIPRQQQTSKRLNSEFTPPALVPHLPPVTSDTLPSSPESFSEQFARQLSFQFVEEGEVTSSLEHHKTMGRVTTNQTPLPKSTARISIDLKNPAANREVMVFPLDNIHSTDGKSVYSGYYIMHPLDNRYLNDDAEVEFYRARVFATSSVLIKVPAWPYSILFNRDEIERDGIDDCVKNAMDDARHSYFEEKANRQWKYLLLEFPEGHELSAKDISADTDDGGVELELEVLEIAAGTGTECWAAWKIARQDMKARKRGKVETGKKMSKAASLLAEKRRKKKASQAQMPSNAVPEEATSSSWFSTPAIRATGEYAHDGKIDDDVSLMEEESESP